MHNEVRILISVCLFAHLLQHVLLMYDNSTFWYINNIEPIEEITLDITCQCLASLVSVFLVFLGS